MNYLIIGAVISFIGLGLMRSRFDLFGIIVVMIGGAIALKGRRELDKKAGVEPINPFKGITIGLKLKGFIFGAFFGCIGPLVSIAMLYGVIESGFWSDLVLLIFFPLSIVTISFKDLELVKQLFYLILLCVANQLMFGGIGFLVGFVLNTKLQTEEDKTK